MSLGLQHPFSLPYGHFGSLQSYPSVVVPISHIFNNHGVSRHGAIADFDGKGASYDAQYLPCGSWVYDGIKVCLYDIPSNRCRTPDFCMLKV